MTKMDLLPVVLILIITMCIVLLFGYGRHFRTQHSANQKMFLAGTVPNPMPDGLLKGSVTGLQTSWQGKSFNATASTGINNFSKNGVETQSYPFKTSVGKGVADKNLEVLKIDYNLPENKWYMR